MTLDHQAYKWGMEGQLEVKHGETDTEVVFVSVLGFQGAVRIQKLLLT